MILDTADNLFINGVIVFLVSCRKRALMEVWAHAWPGSCKHLVRYYSAWVEATSMYVQNEYCNGGSLEAFLQTRREIAAQQHLAGGYQLQEAELAQILLHVAAALHDMHRRKIAHLDVRFIF